MRVLFQSRRTLFSGPGGDTVQLLKTKEFLERRNVKVDISLDLEPDVAGYDVVHVFNLMRGQETFLQVRNAKRRGVPVALSTIYGLYTEYDQKARGGVAGLAARLLGPYQTERAKIVARAVANGELHAGVWSVLLRGYYRTLWTLVRDVDVFLPNSESEMGRVTADFGLSEPRYVVVPNAVDLDVFDYDSTMIDDCEKFRDTVLCVARIEGRKSQLNLVRAMKDLPYQLVLIGQPAPNHRSYWERVRAEAGPNVTLLGSVEHHKLAPYYKAARVHTLISWMETPGLSSLEAGAMGCSLVVTGKGDTRDYFGDEAFYCEPDSVESIRDAVAQAYKASPSLSLRQRIRSQFNWNEAAAKTLEGYQSAL